MSQITSPEEATILYEKIAQGQFQERNASFAGIEYHPDYLGHVGLLKQVQTAREFVDPLIKAYASINEQPVESYDILDAMEEAQQARVKLSEVNRGVSALVRTGLVAENIVRLDNRSSFTYVPTDRAFELNHDAPFYAPHQRRLVGFAGAAGVLGGVLATVPPLTIGSGLAAGGAIAASRATDAVNARKFYKSQGY